MRYRKLDANGDYVIGTGADFWINQPEAVRQKVWTALRLWVGEWFLDQTQGMPWSTQVLGKYTADVYDTVIKQKILSIPEVTDIATYSSSLDTKTRKLSVNVTINTIYGQVLISGPL